MAPSNIEAWFINYKKVWEPPFSLDEFVDLHTEDVVYDDLSIPKVFNGREELREFFVRVVEGIPNFASRYDRFYRQGDVIITEGALIGDQTKPYRGNPPSNRHIELPWVQILHFKEDLIAEVHDYYDRLDFLRQMGVVSLDFTGQPLKEDAQAYQTGSRDIET
jgi:steroid delta-isomerase-like uncharacterized protein